MKNKGNFLRRIIFVEMFVIISSIFSMYIFMPIYKAKKLIIPYAIHPFDICIQYPIAWKKIKIIFIIVYIVANYIIATYLYNFVEKIINKEKSKKIESQSTKVLNQLAIYVGKNEQDQLIYIPEKGLYQNILITRYNRKRKNKFMHVSIHKTINRISKSRRTRKNWNANIRC